MKPGRGVGAVGCRPAASTAEPAARTWAQMRASCPGNAPSGPCSHPGTPSVERRRGNPLKEAVPGTRGPSSIMFRSQKPLINARGELPPGAGTLGRLTWPWLCADCHGAGRLQRSPSSALGLRPPRGRHGPDQPHVHTAWSGPARMTRQVRQDLGTQKLARPAHTQGAPLW